ncbi:biotin--[acetyl-CoA-carboxylase] ligase [Rubrivirga sp.]|uniref:biotin--[acetyl-CoA-carboxylase] ligase n=1 Tax=Rubrivirga sp. TaxID=1885344 RepID=UPI003C72ACA2
MALGTPSRHLEAVDSTMTEAARWGADGAPHGAVVTAQAQRHGRGRHGRVWQSEPSQNLLFTVVLRPDLEADRLGLIPLAAGLAVAEAVAAFGVTASLKWPNDVRVNGQKLAGVLAESSRSASGAVVLLGVGLNVTQTSFPDLEGATSLRMITGRHLAPLSVLDPILDRLTIHLDALSSGPSDVTSAVDQRLERPESPVEVRDPATGDVSTRGRILGLAPDGGLRLDTDTGERVVYAGEVTLSRS